MPSHGARHEPGGGDEHILIDGTGFLSLCQDLIQRGFGHVVLRFIEGAGFHQYLDPTHRFLFSGTPSRVLSPESKAFVVNLLAEFEDVPNRQQVEELFQLQGGVPHRITNAKTLNHEEWIEIWTDWSRGEPEEAARNLLALGFPPSLVGIAFGVREEENGGIGAMEVVLAVAGLALILGGVFLFVSRKRR
jgi:LPXTG-motif cell wall-anchored protein